jgi:hypothetical protein
MYAIDPTAHCVASAYLRAALAGLAHAPREINRPKPLCFLQLGDYRVRVHPALSTLSQPEKML